MKLSFGNLNPSLYPPHLTNTYTCGVTTTLRVRNGKIVILSVRTKFDLNPKQEWIQAHVAQTMNL